METELEAALYCTCIIQYLIIDLESGQVQGGQPGRRVAQPEGLRTHRRVYLSAKGVLLSNYLL